MMAKFITLDGIDGAGKSTHIHFMKQWFEQKKIPVVFTREPGGTPVGEALRNLLLDPRTQASLNTETLMMFAARMQHLEEVIWPALNKGTWVVSDRFTDATFAYQGGGRGVPLHRIEILENWVQQGFEPDLTFLLDVPLEVAQQRVAQTREKDRFEQEQSSFFERTRSVYLDRAKNKPKQYVVLDSTQTIEYIQKQLGNALEMMLE
ncbi:dTMP kinase [Neisseria sp. Ec49-e6-T10]|uniref:dTMP kinase n=1 Tax=Neisseria sp. Ec49-e6-T10 TaxID=3140744 RepID=UPI003EBF18C1